MDNAGSDFLLAVWLVVDLVWGLFIFGGCAYFVFWMNHSAWWFLLAIILGASMGGDKLYNSLRERTKLER